MSDSPKYRGTETQRVSMAAPNLSAPPRSRSDLKTQVAYDRQHRDREGALMNKLNAKDQALLYAYTDISDVLLALESNLNSTQFWLAMNNFAMEDTLECIRKELKGVSHERDRLEPYAGGNWPKETAEETMTKFLKERDLI